MVHVNEDKCIGCNACIRDCPIPNANKTDGKIVSVNNVECIQCGECMEHCSRRAIYRPAAGLRKSKRRSKNDENILEK